MLAQCLPEVAGDPRRRSTALILLPNGAIRAKVPTGPGNNRIYTWLPGKGEAEFWGPEGA
jgi:hypothetical protein